MKEYYTFRDLCKKLGVQRYTLNVYVNRNLLFYKTLPDFTIVFPIQWNGNTIPALRKRVRKLHRKRRNRHAMDKNLDT